MSNLSEKSRLTIRKRAAPNFLAKKIRNDVKPSPNPDSKQTEESLLSEVETFHSVLINEDETSNTVNQSSETAKRLDVISENEPIKSICVQINNGNVHSLSKTNVCHPHLSSDSVIGRYQKDSGNLGSDNFMPSTLSSKEKVDSFSLSVMNQLKKISASSTLEEHPVLSINTSKASIDRTHLSKKEHVDGTEKDSLILKSDCNEDSRDSKTTVTREVIETSEKTNVTSVVQTVNELINTPFDHKNESSSDAEVKCKEDPKVRLPLMRRAIPVLPKKRPAPNLSIPQVKKDQIHQSTSLPETTTSSFMHTNECEPHCKLQKLSESSSNNILASEKESTVDAPNHRSEVPGPNFEERLINIDKKILNESVGSNDNLEANISKNEVKSVASGASGDIHKSIKRRLGPNIKNKSMATNSKAELINEKSTVQFSDKLLIKEKPQNNDLNPLSQVKIPDPVTSKSKEDIVKVVNEKEISEEPRVDNTHVTHVKPCTSSDESKGVLRVYMNCWPNYPLDSDDIEQDPFYAGEKIEEVGKVSIFKNKKHNIAYWDLKRVVDFKKSPKNWVNVNFNKLIKEEFNDDENEVEDSPLVDESDTYLDCEQLESTLNNCNEIPELDTFHNGHSILDSPSSCQVENDHQMIDKVFHEPSKESEDQPCESSLVFDISENSTNNSVNPINDSVFSKPEYDCSEMSSQKLKSEQLEESLFEPTETKTLEEKKTENIDPVMISPVVSCNEESKQNELIDINNHENKVESTERRKSRKAKVPKKAVSQEKSKKLKLDEKDISGHSNNEHKKSKLTTKKKPKRELTGKGKSKPAKKEQPKKLKPDKKSKTEVAKIAEQSKLDSELGSLISVINSEDNIEKPYGLRTKVSKNVENCNGSEDDADKPEDIFSNSDLSDGSEYEAKLESQIKKAKGKSVKICALNKGTVKKHKKPCNSKNESKSSNKEEEKKKVKTPKVFENSSAFHKMSVEVLNKNKWDEEGNCAEPEKLELKDFIFYVPKNEPMSQESKKETKLNINENKEEEVVREEEENHGPKLMVKDGKIIVDPNSTKIKQTPIMHSKVEKTEKPKDTNDPWELRETMKFYGTLWKYGIDFSILAGTFPQKSRESIKKKFNYEEKTNGLLLSKTLTKKLDIKAVLRELILIDCLDKISGKRNVVDKPKKEPQQRKAPTKHCLIQKQRRRRRTVKSKSPVRLSMLKPEEPDVLEEDSQESMNNYLKENVVIISDDVKNLNMKDVITFCTNVIYKDMNIVESVSFHPSAIQPVDVNVTIRHDPEDSSHHLTPDVSASQDTSL